MTKLRTAWIALFFATSFSACWDGSLDPIVAIRGVDAATPDSDGDGDSDGDSDTDNDTETETVETPCEVAILVGFNEWNWCNFTYTGSCLSDASSCVGCAWMIESGQCESAEVCCVEKSDWQSCQTFAGNTLSCGYEAGTSCPYGDPDYDTDIEEPTCSDGNFCCLTATAS